MSESKNGTVLKSDVLGLISCHIRAYAIDTTKYNEMMAPYKILDAIEDMPVREANWLKEPDGRWKCSHCGYKFWNGTDSWIHHCENCGYTMV